MLSILFENMPIAKGYLHIDLLCSVNQYKVISLKSILVSHSSLLLGTT
jgi:hypothetical protein